MRALPPSRYDCSVLPAGQAKRVGECIVDRTCDRTAARSARPAHGKRAARGSSVHARAERAQGGWPARQHAASSRGLAFESHEVTRHAFECCGLIKPPDGGVIYPSISLSNVATSMLVGKGVGAGLDSSDASAVGSGDGGVVGIHKDGLINVKSDHGSTRMA